ncbi:hypothetical protein [Anaerolentibacter hominis]|uniref:hypothetical protein n=1 Tax=Anaerolentibacter hominis TaxID=3079009 RepID=UPI0031B7FF54
MYYVMQSMTCGSQQVHRGVLENVRRSRPEMFREASPFIILDSLQDAQALSKFTCSEAARMFGFLPISFVQFGWIFLRKAGSYGNINLNLAIFPASGNGIKNKGECG